MTINPFEITYRGGTADNGLLSFYDASISYRGLARTLALVGHYYVTGEIIAKAPFAKVEIFITPPAEGSFKQTVLVGVASAIIAVPFTVFFTEAVESWFPQHDPQLAQILTEAKKQTEILEAQLTEEQRARLASDRALARRHMQENRSKIDVIRSITSSSFRDIFRPVGRSVTSAVIDAGPLKTPVGSISPTTVGLLDTDIRDHQRVSVVGTVSGFSRGSKTGVMFSKSLERGFRFEFMGAERLAKEDIFSWSQFTQKEIFVEGEWVYFFDGTIKKLLIYHAEPLENDAPGSPWPDLS